MLSGMPRLPNILYKGLTNCMTHYGMRLALRKTRQSKKEPDSNSPTG